MKLSNHEEYGLRCLLRLAEQGPGGSLTIHQISQSEGVSKAYAAKLLRMLRRAGFVKATRGKVGGYALARPAGRIIVGEAMNVFGAPMFEGDFCRQHAGQLEACVRSAGCSVRSLWRRVQESVDCVLGRTTLESLLPEGAQWPSGQSALEISGERPSPFGRVERLQGILPMPARGPLRGGQGIAGNSEISAVAENRSG